MDNGKAKIIVGGVIIAVIGLIILIVVLNSDELVCVPGEAEVKYENYKPEEHKPKTIKDKAIAAKFVGHIVYPKDPKREGDKDKYLPLNLKSIDSEKDESNRLYKLKLNLDCAQITVGNEYELDENKVIISEKIRSVEIKLTTKHNDIDTFTADNFKNVSTNTGFNCQSHEYAFKSNDKEIKVYFRDFKFELNRSSAAKDEEFEKDKEYSECS